MRTLLRPGVQAWALYDFANTIFSMNIITMYFAQWVVVDRGFESLWYSGAYSLSMALTALTLPVLGALSDSGGRTRFLLAYTVAAVVATGAMGPLSHALAGRAGVFAALAAFSVANYAYQGSLVFYNALLPGLSPPGRMGLVSGYGVFLGYVGAIAGLLLVAPFARGPLLPAAFGEGRAAAFLPTAVFFAVFAVPLFLAVRDGPRRGPRASLREAIHEVREGLLDTRRYPGVRTLLVANFLLVDAVNTGILYMAVYAQVVMGMDDRAKLPLFIVSTTTAALGSLAAGRACDRWGARRTLNVVFAVWAVALLALAVNTRVWLFWVLGSAVGAALGATWTAVRPLLAQLTPPESHGRFFGLYALSDKSAAVLGPLVWGLIVWAFRSDPVLRYRLAVAALALFVIAGFIIYRRVPEPKPARPAAEEAPS